MKKVDNNRRYPGESCTHRPDNAEGRRSEAQERQKLYDALTDQQKLDKLDLLFGVGKGAAKQRLQLSKSFDTNITTKENVAIEGLASATLPDHILAEINAINEEMPSKRKLKAKERRAKKQNF